MTALWWVLLGVALAEDPVPAPVPEPVVAPAPAGSPDPSRVIVLPASEAGVAEEILIIGEDEVRAARKELVRAIEAQGWTAIDRSPDGIIIFKPPESWIGRARLSPDGELSFGTKLANFNWAPTGADAEYNSKWQRPGQMGDPNRNLNGGTPFGSNDGSTASAGIPSKRKQQGAQSRLFEAVGADLTKYRSVVRQSVFSDQLREIPLKLDKLWIEGQPFEPGALVTDPGAKRALVLDYWATRAETPEGRAVSRSVEVWLREVVQPSATPCTPAEIAAAEAKRADGRKLGL